MTPRPRLIVGNWKMHKTIPEARALIEQLAEHLRREPAAPVPLPAQLEIVVVPPFTALSAVASVLAQQSLFVGAGGGASRPGPSPVSLAAQDMHWEDAGAYTGEISPPMLKDLGCRYVLVGHSERRRSFGETDAIVRKKVLATLRHGLRPILCIGETWDQRARNQTQQVLTAQLTEALTGVDKDQGTEVVIAYEPVWAIGSGQSATPPQAREAHRHVRARVTAQWGHETGERVPILYGGSVTPDNIGELLAIREVDGALVGGACLDPAQFARILSIAGSTKA
ncbi:MAG TPA: triose-phosphate isomerase [Nitrospirales bacterium]|nr:triose-phosphate isomerase [Nitrospirales bacterium]